MDGSLPLSVQCELLGLNRSSLYYKLTSISSENLVMMNYIDRIHNLFPGFGVDKVRDRLSLVYHIKISYKRVYTFMRAMRLIKKVNKNHHYHKYPYLLKTVDIENSNQCWSIDITYIGLEHGHTFMFAMIDWHSRMILGYIVSNKIDSLIVIEEIQRCISVFGVPQIINSDNGSEFASGNYLEFLDDYGICVSMNRKGKPADNIAIERFFRSMKSEKLYYEEYDSLIALKCDIDFYIEEYNHRRTHRRHYLTPANAYKNGLVSDIELRQYDRL